MNNLLKKLFLKQNVEIDDNGRILLNFFYENKGLFQEYFCETNSNQNKKIFIKNIYTLLNYTNPTIYEPLNSSNTIILYRGINATTKEDLLSFVKSFSTGEVFFGKRASLFGTGIYLSKNYYEALKYATYNANYGVVIQCILSETTKIIEYHELTRMKNNSLLKLTEKYTEQDIIQYIDLLEDDGLFAAILGYDAINIQEKDFVLVLNRSKLFVNEMVYH